MVFDKAAEFLLAAIHDQLKTGSKVLLLLSGGSAVKLYKIITYHLSLISYNNLAIAQLDERFQPVNNNDANANSIGKTGLWKVCKKRNIPYYLVSQEGTLKESAEKYDQTISKLFKEYTYKLAVLGIGEDAHTAGLLPGYEKIWNVDSFIVGYKLKGNGQNGLRDLICPEMFKQRITITPKALAQLDQAIVVAVGEKKREALRKINYVKIKDINKYPAAILQKIKKVDLFTDTLSV